MKKRLLILAGAFPLLLILLLFKSQVCATNDLVANLGLAETGRRLFDPARHLTICRAFVVAGFQIASAYVAVIPLCLWLLGRRAVTAADRSGRWFAVAVLGMMLAGYYVAYLTTPYELSWHLSTSVDRLLVQLWPTAVLAIFSHLRAPEEIWPRAQQGIGFQTSPVQGLFKSAPAQPITASRQTSPIAIIEL